MNNGILFQCFRESHRQLDISHGLPGRLGYLFLTTNRLLQHLLRLPMAANA